MRHATVLTRRKEVIGSKAPCYGTSLAVYHMLRHSTLYHDLGAEHFRRISHEPQANRLAKLIAKLGFSLTLAPIQPNGSVSV